MKIRKAFPWSKTVNIKVPAPCCKWCNIQYKSLAQWTENLEELVAELESRSTVDQSLAVFNTKLDAAVRLFDHTMNADARGGYFVGDPVMFTQLFKAAFEVVESVFGDAKTSGSEEAKRFKTALSEVFVPMSSVHRNGKMRSST